jgi:hypothetical protein
MGVMACDRKNCDNVMCDRISDERQEYLCWECFDELVHLGPSTDLDKFMASRPRRVAVNIAASRAYFDQIFTEVEQ